MFSTHFDCSLCILSPILDAKAPELIKFYSVLVQVDMFYQAKLKATFH